jgi:hypothetical protein
MIKNIMFTKLLNIFSCFKSKSNQKESQSNKVQNCGDLQKKISAKQDLDSIFFQ